MSRLEVFKNLYIDAIYFERLLTHYINKKLKNKLTEEDRLLKSFNATSHPL